MQSSRARDPLQTAVSTLRRASAMYPRDVAHGTGSYVYCITGAHGPAAPLARCCRVVLAGKGRSHVDSTRRRRPPSPPRLRPARLAGGSRGPPLPARSAAAARARRSRARRSRAPRRDSCAQRRPCAARAAGTKPITRRRQHQKAALGRPAHAAAWRGRDDGCRARSSERPRLARADAHRSKVLLNLMPTWLFSARRERQSNGRALRTPSIPRRRGTNLSQRCR